MRKVYRLALEWLSLLAILLASPLLATAAGNPVQPSLVISQFKLTSSSGQYVTLYNQSDSPLNLSQFELDYTSSSGKTSTVPMTGTLPSHNFYMLSDDAVRLCYQTIVDASSLGFTVTSGNLQLWQVVATPGAKTLTLQDNVAWATKASTGVVALPAQNADFTTSLFRQTADPANLQVTAPGTGNWLAVQPDPKNACALQAIVTAVPVATPVNTSNQLLAAEAPPATIVSVTSDDTDTTAAAAPAIPSSDIGLQAPTVNELLPNPAGTSNDGTDEFIELYNANDVSFDLSGFVLQTGTTTKHKYTFPSGTALPGKSFTSFYSSDTGLTLSNTSGQAALLDPLGNTVSQSDAYGTAKDGMAWALAKGGWYWTSQLTPGAANVIKAAATTASTKSSSKTTAKKSTTTASPKSSSTGSGSASSGGTTTASQVAQVTPVHPWTLVVVAALAVAYGIYEYRLDLANRLYQFRKHRATRRGTRFAVAGR